MEMSNKIKFLLISTCVLFIGSCNGLYLEEENKSIDTAIQVTDNVLNSKITFKDESVTLPTSFLDTSEATTTILSETTTKVNSLLLKKVTENAQTATVPENKSFINNETLNHLAKSEKDIIEVKGIELTTEMSITDAPISTEIPSSTMNEKTLEEIFYSNESTFNEVMNSTNAQETSLNSSKNLIDSRPEEHIEIQKITTTGEDLEESIKKSVRDEILIENPIDQNALDVLENIPDPELRESVARDILGDDYIRRSELNANINPDTINAKYETISPNLDLKEQTNNSEHIGYTKQNEHILDSGRSIQQYVDENKLYVTATAAPEVETKSIDLENILINEHKLLNTTTTAPEVEYTTSELNKMSVTEMALEETELNFETTTMSKDLGVEQNKKEDSLLNMQERGGRAMIFSNSIINHDLIDNTIYMNYMSTPSPTELFTEMPTTETTNYILFKNQDKENPISTFVVPEKTIEYPSSENEIENNVKNKPYFMSQDTFEHHHNQPASVGEYEISTTQSPTPIQDKSEVPEQEGEVKYNFTTEVPETDKDILVTTESLNEYALENNNLNQVVASEQDSIKVMLQEEIESAYIDHTTQKKINLKEISDSSSSDSSEEIGNAKKDKTTVVKSKKKSDKSSSASDSSSEEFESGENDSETKKSITNPKARGRSFALENTPQLVESVTEVLTTIPENSASEDSSSKEEHFIMKKPSAESEDENSLIPISAIIKTTENPKLNLLNPRLKFLLVPDEAKKIPQLTFETTTLLPLKIFKSHPLQPVVTDDIPNETNFAPRTLDEIIPSQQKEQQQSYENEINQILETESTTKLIGETFTEAVELSKEINRNMNLFLDPFETNQSISTLGSENHSTSSDEIMAESSIAEALPNQDIKSIESSMNPTLVILICVSIIVMIIAVLVVTFFRFRTPQGVLDIEMQEQRHGKNYNNEHDDEIINEKDYNCCTTARSLSTSGIEDTSILSTSSSSKSSVVKRTISDSRSNNSSAQSISLLSEESNNKEYEKEKQKQQTIPAEMCKLIPKLQINGDNNFDDYDENL